MNTFKQKGSATVEFAMLLPLLLLLVFTVSEFGVMFYRLNALTKSVDIAARYLSGAEEGYPNTTVHITEAKNLAVNGNTTGSGSAIVPGLTSTEIVITNDTTHEHVKVVATYNANFILLNTLKNLQELFSKGSGSGTTSFMTLNASSVMRFAT